MKVRSFLRYVIGAAAVALLAGCGGSQQPIGAPDTLTQIHSTTTGRYRVLHSFGSKTDGQDPKAALIDVAGTLYGTTYAGGADGDGTVFSISTSGTETVLYSFQGRSRSDGSNPAAALLSFDGALYGTTEYGGVTKYSNNGTVFSVSSAGAETILHNFTGYYGTGTGKYRYDGANPIASLTSLGGKLYGTTYNGGLNNYGTVFRVNKQGNEKVLHSFTFEIYGDDGAYPSANLLNLNDVLYGTTTQGTSTQGGGTVFTITPNGTENDLYNFPYGGADGGSPFAGLIAVHGTLYGTTGYGGAYSRLGTAFSITPTGTLTSLHKFGSGSDGARPEAPLLDVKGTLYGTTSLGGTYNEGTIFKMTLAGDETVLHSFANGTDGATPLAGLINVKGTLYGTTSAGGTKGNGTVFALRIKP
jgi:uncharacterized repeat protein (TIGR03803 family)